MRNALTATRAGRAFLDTNILIYAEDPGEPVKHRRSRNLIAAVGHHGVISTQVMQEFFSSAVRKLHLDPYIARGATQRLNAFEVVQVTPPIIEAAMDCVILHQVSIWNALILAAAASAGCRTLYTEDLQAGTTLLGVRVENPLA